MIRRWRGLIGFESNCPTIDGRSTSRRLGPPDARHGEIDAGFVLQVAAYLQHKHSTNPAQTQHKPSTNPAQTQHWAKGCCSIERGAYVCFSKSFLNCKKAQGLARSRDDVNTQVRTLISLKSPSSMIFQTILLGHWWLNNLGNGY